ncbi:MAG: Kae1-associated kinase Bud32 [Conexivisphaerales archaeon]
MEVLIKRGAEADIILGRWMGIRAVYKRRKPRPYMFPMLDDQLRRHRTVREAELLCRAREKGLLTPAIYFVDVENSTITMQYVHGDTLKSLLNNPEDRALKAMEDMGRILGWLHSVDIVHGDPTTSNFIINSEGLYILDFGLSYISRDIEDKAVDIHLVREVLYSAHPSLYDTAYEYFLKGYEEIVKNASAIIERSGEIEKRGRYSRREWIV